MKFDFDLFLTNLKPFEVKDAKQSKDTQEGLVKVIEHVWMHSNTSEIDFNSFTLNDVQQALEVIHSLPLHWDDSGEQFTCDPRNPLMVVDSLTDVAWALKNTNKKRFLMEEDDLFL